MINKDINEQEEKQGNEYLSKLYSYARCPLSDYPNQLSQHLS